MKEEVLQIFVADCWLYAMCKGGKIYRKSTTSTATTPDWELLSEAPKISYGLPKKPQKNM